MTSFPHPSLFIENGWSGIPVRRSTCISRASLEINICRCADVLPDCSSYEVVRAKRSLPARKRKIHFSSREGRKMYRRCETFTYSTHFSFFCFF